MKRMLLVLFVSTGLIFSCNSNKGGRGAFGKKGKHRSHKSASASGKRSSGSSTASSASISDSTSTTKTGTSSLKITEGFDPNSRPGLIYNGSSGPGTGGSYASAAYRQTRMPKKNRKELYKYRAYLNADGLYPNTGNNNAMEDSSLVQSDSTWLDNSTLNDSNYDNSGSMTVESDSTDYSY